MQLHQRKRSKASLSNEYETPKKLFDELCLEYKVKPLLDVCANSKNTKCISYLIDAEHEIWPDVDVWCNPPHSQNNLFVALCYFHWQEKNRNVMMILPTNTMSSKYWHQVIQPFAEFHPLKGRINFLVNGNLSANCSRNAYVCVIWRRRNV